MSASRGAALFPGWSYAATACAPTDSTKAAFFAEHTPATKPAPRARAICTARCPTPPLAPSTSTCCPGAKPCWSRSCATVTPGKTSAAACSCVRLSGFLATWSRGTETSSASAPRNGGTAPYTSSPTAKPHPGGACSTTPDKSKPAVLPSTSLRANPRRKGGSLSPMTPFASTGLTPHAFTRTSKAFLEGAGNVRLVTTRMPSGHPRSYTAARMSRVGGNVVVGQIRRRNREARSAQ